MNTNFETVSEEFHQFKAQWDGMARQAQSQLLSTINIQGTAWSPEATYLSTKIEDISKLFNREIYNLEHSKSYWSVSEKNLEGALNDLNELLNHCTQEHRICSIEEIKQMHAILSRIESLLMTGAFHVMITKVQSDYNAEIVTKLEDVLGKANADAAEIAKTKANSESVHKELQKYLAEIEKYRVQIAKDREEIAKDREEIAKAFKEVNQVGLAKSFTERQGQKEKASRLWSQIFLGSLGCWIIINIVISCFETKNSGLTDYLDRLLFNAPMIWLVWFTARQYGDAQKIAEDYAFKAATAMAFEAYKNEVKDNQEMLDLLLGSTVRNFSANPAKIFSKNSGAESPLDDIINIVSSPTQKLEKIANMLRRPIQIMREIMNSNPK